MPSAASYHTANFYREATLDEVGQRLDRSLLKLPIHPSKHLIQRLIRTGKIKINAKKTLSSYRIQENDILEFPKSFLESDSEQELRSDKHLQKKLESAGKDFLKLTIYEDDELLICNKPCGISVHGGSAQTLDLISALRAARPDLNKLNLVHRLDRPTSGVLIFAKNLTALRNLHQQFLQFQIKKNYVSILYGDLPPSMQWPVRGSLLKKNQKRDLSNPQTEQKAETHFLILEKLNANFCLVKVTPKEGRTHQIRIHAASSNLPVLGDHKYSHSTLRKSISNDSEIIAQACLKFLPKNAIFLHAFEVSFIHPKTGEPLRINAPLPEFWEKGLSALHAKKEYSNFF